MSDQPSKDQHEEAYLSLTKGLDELDFGGGPVPCDLVLIGDHSFPIAMNSRGQVPMAASFYGKGRIVVMGHEGYLRSFPDLVKNAVAWLRGEGSGNLSVGVHENVKAVADNLQNSGFQAEVVEDFSDKLDVAVFVTNAYSVADNHKALVTFMRKGGGVLIAGQAWHWASQNRKRNILHEFDGNKVADVAGIYFSGQAVKKEKLPVYPQIPSSWMAMVLGKDFEDDLRFLLNGISEFKIPKNVTASEILVHGPLAFPIGCTEDKKTFLAGGYYGQGRVIVVSHEGLLKLEDMAPFWKNALLWLDEGRKGVVGIRGNHGHKILSKSGLKCQKTNLKEDLSVYVTLPKIDNPEEIVNFVAEGGGLLLAGHAWHWAMTHKKQHVLRDCPANKVLNKMGLSLLAQTLKGRTCKAPDPSRVLQETYHFRHLLHRFACHVNAGDKLTKHEEDCFKNLDSHCSTYLSMKAHDCPPYKQVVSTLSDIVKKSHVPPVSGRTPLKQPKERLLLSVGTSLYQVCPNQEEILSCLVADNPVMPVVYNHKVKVDVDTKESEWISTGLYLSPGMKTYVAAPPELVNQKWKIQIGCQTDKLKGDVLKRAPDVCQRFPINSSMTQVSNLWGGLIYLVAPKNAKVKGAEVTVQVAVPAPYYKSGETTAEQWELLRTAPSPWAELEFENIIFTMSSKAVRKLERPDKLAAIWDEIMRAIAALAARPAKFHRKERFVSEVQISHGYMHAGYPIMAHSDIAKHLVDVKVIKEKGMWGVIHELGHNQQQGCWEFPPHTTEATCNLWSVYVNEELLGNPRHKAHTAVSKEKRRKRAADYVKAGRNLGKWSMWTALETYLQLQDEFGWDPYKKVFAAYQKMTNIPKDKNAKMNLYAETFSKTVGMNLCGFFKAWGWPIKAETEQKLSDLPPWNDHPMAQFD
ncbi:TRPM8 channel-associated factor homolog [Salarias fasciatus]|uniref:TRPM8 channel-associated factor homolog n=1 Tax=Salarias fasciatus TaxID=181472 RepID=A0A672IVK7_SALFA|nr:TRPM8 channel-associated factor homolog [Salarias fasciatus]XP_029964491.1 TRPM8 channel-associated factor homolog [Salarias fasciatus]XP_029964492.1 TRPM8 channel-associated factor homolog [Salarias fasciatus]